MSPEPADYLRYVITPLLSDTPLFHTG